MDFDIDNDVIGQSEDALQQKCVFWFHNTYPLLRGCLFSVPNGGTRDKREVRKLKATGLTPGVSDLLFLYDRNAYLIELKRDKYGVQSPAQKDWQKVMEAQGFDYYLEFTLEKFKEIIKYIIG